MNIDKTYKLYIKDTSFELTEEEVTALYEACRKALNIKLDNTNPFPNYPPGVRKFEPVVPTYPSWPTYPGTANPDPLWHIPYVTCNDNKVR